MVNSIIAVILTGVFLFLGYVVSLTVAVGIICYKQAIGKPVPKLLQKLAGDLVR